MGDNPTSQATSKACLRCRKSSIDTVKLPERNYCDDCVEELSKDKDIRNFYASQYTKDDHKKNREFVQLQKHGARGILGFKFLSAHSFLLTKFT